MNEILGQVAGWGAGGMGAGMGFFFVRWLAVFAAGRWDKKEEHLDQVTRELIDALRAEITTLRANEETMRHRLDATDERLNDCLRKHIDSDREIARLRVLVEQKG